MADDVAKSGGLKSWLKMGLGTAGGLVSGVVVMYLNAAFSQVIKPAKPVPNFKYEREGLSVRFQNLSQGGAGWWDFGDGSPLEPATANQQFVTHAYPRAGDFTAKLSLRNVLGEDAERSVAVKIDPPPRTEPPRIAILEAIPMSPGGYAPATFRLVSKVSNAQLCVWDLGDERPLEITPDPGTAADRMVTFQKAGGYIVKLAAISGTQHDEKTEIVTVMEPPTGTITAIVNLNDSGTRVETRQETFTFGAIFPPEFKDDVLPFERQAMAQPGFVIADMRIAAKPEIRLGNNLAQMALDAAALGIADVRNLQLQLSSDRRTATLAGELLRGTTRGAEAKSLPGLALPVVLVQQRSSPATRPPIPVAATLGLPSGGVSNSVLLHLPQLPSDWVGTQRRMSLELRDSDKVIWPDAPMPRGGVYVKVGTRQIIFTATKINETVRIDLIDPPTGLVPLANESTSVR